MPDLPKHSVSVAGVVLDSRGRILLARRRDNGRWEPPGGVLEPEESFEHGVRREILEETEVSVGVDRLTGAYKHLARGVVTLVFRCHALGGSPRATEESSAADWFELADALALMTESRAARVTDALRDTPAVRTYPG
ncbi:ADP-ribose pyrophosphatase YjhB (NUDIX family) [Actinopolyspora biskrensis]|uniref:ADP-ribose pyrophosphatase YjhB (NUDIX family) n=1 Tax=Actinopolyspora biskrensis TaxID=1470178 RepID=A0A852Z092_9ACTN|nr:NUDIX domain-containing protein [Actinopolyspora biskrensis]NYH79630.1 ADP-ribose pyrophosphatase YjhB (NUDIX family) [Actinopolyspora biskrensis]